MAELVRELNGVPLAGLMLVVALGFTLGRFSFRGFSLGPAGGTLLVALLAGAAGLSFREIYGEGRPLLTVGGFGFALFIYSVGFEAGPQFFSSLRGGPGWRFVLVGVTVSVLAVLAAVAAGRLFSLGGSITAGVLSGALTSAPTYAAAAEICSDRAALAVSFALTYPVGLAGVILLVQFLPRFFGDRLAGDLRFDARPEDPDRLPPGPEVTRAFRVEREGVLGRTLRELDLTHATGCYVTRLHRGTEVHIPHAGTMLELGDHVLARGRLDELRAFEALVGPEIYDEELRKRFSSPRRIAVTHRAAAGKTLAELRIPQRHRCLVTAVDRAGVAVEPSAELVILRGDVLEVTGPPGGVRAVAEELGRFEGPTNETDIAVYAGGIFLGILLGRARLTALGFPFTLGTAGGLLLAGVLLGRFRRIGPLSANVPAPARQLVRDLGILLFVAETGVAAGGSSHTGLHGLYWPTLAAAALVVLLPVLGAVFVGRRILHLNPAETWGSVGGGMTSSTALLAIRRAAESNEPALSYAAAYAVASVLVTVAGQVVVLLMVH